MIIDVKWNQYAYYLDKSTSLIHYDKDKSFQNLVSEYLTMSGSSNAMKFITPDMYAKSQESHFNINKYVVNEFVETYGALVESDKVLDLGSGTGETTAAMAQVSSTFLDYIVSI